MNNNMQREGRRGPLASGNLGSINWSVWPRTVKVNGVERADVNVRVERRYPDPANPGQWRGSNSFSLAEASQVIPAVIAAIQAANQERLKLRQAANGGDDHA